MNAVVKMLVITLLTLSLPVSVLAASGNPRVAPIGSRVHGLTYTEWSVKWWQWLLSIPADQSPTFDTTGEDCAVGQSGHVWFLAGTPGGSATRTCTVPPGTSLFFPIINAEFDYPCPDPGFQPAPGQSLEAFLTENVTTLIDAVKDLALEIDGVAVENLGNYRVTSPLFEFVGHPSLTAVFDSCITGSSQPAVSDGYWVMLPPLSRGSHTIHLHGAIDGFGFETDVTYTLLVE